MSYTGEAVLIKKRRKRVGRKRKPQRCKYCNQMQPGRDACKYHQPRCPEKPVTATRGRPPIPKSCPWCHTVIPSTRLYNEHIYRCAFREKKARRPKK